MLIADSFFGEQEGDFSISLQSIEATSSLSIRSNSMTNDILETEEFDGVHKPLGKCEGYRGVSKPGLMSWLSSCFERAD